MSQAIPRTRVYDGVSARGLAACGSSPGPLLIGAQRDDGIFFNGDGGEMRVYRRVLNGAEVTALAVDSGEHAQACQMSRRASQGVH
jgi:hypothetical protein